jgi:hypothetical protein
MQILLEKTTGDPIAMFNLILAFSTVGLWAATFFLYRAGEKQIAVTARSSIAAIEAANVAGQTLVATQRAWIKASLSVTTPLIFDKNGATTSVGFKISNIGNTPAIGITPNAWLMALTSGGPYPGTATEM